MDEPIRILQCGMTNNYGGVETFIMSIYKNIDRKKIQFDFLTTHDGVIAYEDEIKQMGGRIFKIEYSSRENFVKHFFSLKKFFEEHGSEFKAVHMNKCYPNYTLPLKYAKRSGIENRIVHSHCSKSMIDDTGISKRIKSKMDKYKITKRATKLLACSDEAGKYLFENNDFEIIPNGIDMSLFKFNNEIRNKLREQLKITDKYVLGMVGRLAYPKNVMFSLKILKELCRHDKSYVLLLVGDGNERREIEDYICASSLQNNVIILGKKENVESYYQAMDLFLFPSEYEGFGISMVEAQTSGLRCIASDRVPITTKITEVVEYLSIDNGVEEWIRKIEEARKTKIDRLKQYEKCIKTCYNIDNSIDAIMDIYEKGGTMYGKKI